LSKKVVFCVPTYQRMTQACMDSIEAAVPLIEAAGYEHGMVIETGNAYISAARATMLRSALDAKADITVFIDDDVSFEPSALVKLIDTPGEVVAGTYRTREDHANYMGRPIQSLDGKITSVREDGCIEMACVPAGFLKITLDCVTKFMLEYPDLCYGTPWHYSVDLFNHGAYKGLWWGEDYSFCRRWRDIRGKVWCIPNLNIDHNCRKSGRVYKGNYHEYLARQPGGAKEGQPYSHPDYGFNSSSS
jgi:glycosyltransferase involved in cell wall biosynthesis